MRRKTVTRQFTGNQLSEIAFPLGGIGTGCISLGGRGQLQDWEIFNHPGKGFNLPFSFFAIWAQAGNHSPVAKILERKLLPPYSGGFGTPQQQMTGVARLDEATFCGEYPFAWIDFQDAALPVSVSLEAWNPFIPLNETDSSLPVAIFNWQLTNPGKKTVAVSIAACLFNPIGTDGHKLTPEMLGQNTSEFREAAGFCGVYFSSARLTPADINNGTMALATPFPDYDVQTCWYRGGWWDNAQIFWDDFAADGRVNSCTETANSPDNKSDVSDLVLHTRLAPGESITLPFFLAWHFPLRENYWNSESAVKGKKMRNFVATQFKDAWAALEYTAENLDRLETQSRQWHQAFYQSTLPDFVLDAAGSQASILRTNTCFRLDDGSFFAFEGQADERGCCPLNCTHVWNYEQTLAHLFPRLERSMRETDFLHNLHPDNSMAFRTLVPLCDTLWDYKPAADGQMGCILKAYREWKFSGDSAWLRKLWPQIKQALEYAWTQPNGWDADQDGVMEGEQHNTYDIEFYGPNTMMGTLYLGALKAAAEMAQALGEAETAALYHEIFESGRQEYDERVWNGGYYFQKVSVPAGLEIPKHLKSPSPITCDCKSTPSGRETALSADSRQPKYQYGSGCLSDQLLGQWFAHVVGLGYLLDPAHIKTAMWSIFENNWRTKIGEFSNVQRVYALNDESGLLLCSWPHGNRPALPFVYSDEVWTGIEYQVAAHLIYEGWITEGLKIVAGLRNRYDGARRNPWNEVECGHHYARALASWSLVLALSGFQYDGVVRRLEFAPKWHPEKFQSFWSTGQAWGTFAQKITNHEMQVEIQVLFGTQFLTQLVLTSAFSTKISVQINGRTLSVAVKTEGEKIRIDFPEKIKLEAGSGMNILLR